MVKSSQQGGINFTKIQDVFWSTLHDIPSYNKALEKGLLIDLGDGGFIATDISHLPVLLNLAKELSVKLGEYNKSQVNKELHITVRQGIHVGHCKVQYSGGKIVQINGSGIIYATRVMNLDADGGHILLTNSACATIQSQTMSYRDDLYYLGKYPIKHGQFLRVWNYHHDDVSVGKKETNFGIAEAPTKKKSPAILKINKKNQVLGIALIAISVVAAVLGGIIFAQFYEDINISDFEKNQIKSNLEEKVIKLIEIQKEAVRQIEPEFSDAILDDAERLTLSDIQKESTRPILMAISFHPEIEYAILSNPVPHCNVLLYEPYGKIYDETIDFTGYERCIEMQTHTTYLTSTYYATGPGKFVTTLVTTVNNNFPDDKSTIAHLVMGINWNPIINDVRKTIALENVRMILVDHKESIVLDCFNQDCKEFEENAKQRKVSSFDDSYLSNEDYEIITIPFEGMDIPFENEHIMKDWRLYVLYPQSDLFSLNTLQLSAVITPLIVLGLLIYYYLVPRNWLDEDDTTENLWKE